MAGRKSAKTVQTKMYNYPTKIFAENTNEQGQKMSNLQITVAALMTLGISIGEAKRIYLQLEEVVRKSPQLNRYDILLAMAQKIAVIL